MASKIVTIDYSMTSPSWCIDGNEIHFVSGNKKKYDGFVVVKSGFRIIGHVMPEYSSDADRFDKLSDIVMANTPDGADYFIENYAMGAKGRVFAIGENTGVLKHKLLLRGVVLDTIGIATIKKHATGKGNANKEAMGEAFTLRHKFDMHELVGGKASGSPSSDIVDAWWMYDYIASVV